MFNTIYEACTSLFHFNQVTNTLEELISHFDEDYDNDPNARDAAIDAICQVLQAHKSTAPNKG